MTQLGDEGMQFTRDLISVLDILFNNDGFLVEASDMEVREMRYARDMALWITQRGGENVPRPIAPSSPENAHETSTTRTTRVTGWFERVQGIITPPNRVPHNTRLGRCPRCAAGGYSGSPCIFCGSILRDAPMYHD